MQMSTAAAAAATTVATTAVDENRAPKFSNPSQGKRGLTGGKVALLDRVLAPFFYSRNGHLK